MASTDGRAEDLQRLNELILGSAGEGIYGLDTRGVTTFVNPAAAGMLGWEMDDLVGEPMHALLHHSHPDGSPFPREECPIYAAFKDGHVHFVDDEVFWRRDGSSFPVEYTSTPIEKDGALVGAVVVFRDVTLRREAEAELKRAHEELRVLKDQLEVEKEYLEEEIKRQHGFAEIIGESEAIKATLRAVDTVAPTEAPVLITGETGTGKELIARAIHDHSPRGERALIKVNCASIPRDLFESEFFGHVKGAFTGAVKERVGRFQLADRGTLFLDEIGEIPVEMQAKLLRVLQEGELERVGGSSTHKVDVRIIAATNRDLRQEVDAGRFREDLYYRLSVFPIDVPPLRRRQRDIPLLANHYLATACRRLDRKLRMTSAHIADLTSYSWPGNVRELRNVIDRAAIVSREGPLRLELPEALEEIDAPVPEADEHPFAPESVMRERERQNLMNALKHADGKIYGPGGAAELLGLKPTTLAARLKKAGIHVRRTYGS